MAVTRPSPRPHRVTWKPRPLSHIPGAEVPNYGHHGGGGPGGSGRRLAPSPQLRLWGAQATGAMASLGSAPPYCAYGQGHGEPRFEGDLRHGPFGAHEAFGYPGTGDGGDGGFCFPGEGPSAGFPAALCLATARDPPSLYCAGRGALTAPQVPPWLSIPPLHPPSPLVPLIPLPQYPQCPSAH